MALLNNANDANAFLSNTDLTLTDSNPDDIRAFEEAARMVRGRLASFVDTAVLNAWDVSLSPSNVPEQVRSIAGRFSAAIRFRALYTGDINNNSPYAQTLYNEALNMLNQIKTGDYVLMNPDGTLLDLTGGESHLDGDDYFYPNDSTIGESDDVKFTMGVNF